MNACFTFYKHWGSVIFIQYLHFELTIKKKNYLAATSFRNLDVV